MTLAIDFGYAPAALALTNLLEKKQRYNEALPILLAGICSGKYRQSCTTA